MKTIIKLQDRKVQLIAFAVLSVVLTAIIIYMAHIGVIHIDKY